MRQSSWHCRRRSRPGKPKTPVAGTKEISHHHILGLVPGAVGALSHLNSAFHVRGVKHLCHKGSGAWKSIHVRSRLETALGALAVSPNVETSTGLNLCSRSDLAHGRAFSSTAELRLRRHRGKTHVVQRILRL